MTQYDAPKVSNHRRQACYLKQSLPLCGATSLSRCLDVAGTTHVSSSIGGWWHWSYLLTQITRTRDKFQAFNVVLKW